VVCSCGAVAEASVRSATRAVAMRTPENYMSELLVD
jgi:hypothetical protein